jgi:hypothetical protein
MGQTDEFRVSLFESLGAHAFECFPQIGQGLLLSFPQVSLDFGVPGLLGVHKFLRRFPLCFRCSLTRSGVTELLAETGQFLLTPGQVLA